MNTSRDSRGGGCNMDDVVCVADCLLLLLLLPLSMKKEEAQVGH
jgi:hypothetical protein